MAGVAIYSAASLTGSLTAAKAPDSVKSKKPGSSQFLSEDDAWSYSLTPVTDPPSSGTITQYPWRSEIVTTTFWVGEKPSENNPVPNRKSCWDPKWAANYGGTDSPRRDDRLDTFPSTSPSPTTT
jgi:hypothetical protein